MESKTRCFSSSLAVLRYQGHPLAYLRDMFDGGTYEIFELNPDEPAWSSLLCEGPNPLDAMRNAAFGDRLTLAKVLKSPGGLMRGKIYDLRTANIISPQRGFLRIYDPHVRAYDLPEHLPVRQIV